jgi:hypothetical protein
MARKLYYRISDDGRNRVTEEQWQDIQRLQHWYNSEFEWTAGRLAFKMFAVFPNMEYRTFTEEEIWEEIVLRRTAYQQQGLSENDIIRKLAADGIVFAKKGGYFDGCLASGFTRVAGNEFNAYLVCEFLLKASRIASEAEIILHDEGGFVKPKDLRIKQGGVTIPITDVQRLHAYEGMITSRHVFSIVDVDKYDQFPRYQSTIADFNELPKDERQMIVRDWNWLGFDNTFDANGDDTRGYDLNQKVSSFRVEVVGGA